MEDTIFNIYQYIGSYFTGTSRRRVLCVFLLIFSIIIIAIFTRLNIHVPSETLNLVFSSLIQALLSLVALLGVTAFFKLEILKNEEDKIIELATTINQNSYSWLANHLQGKLIASGEELMTELKSVLKEGNPQDQKISLIKKKLEDVFLGKEIVQKNILNFTVYTFFVATLSLIFLISTPLIVRYNFDVVSLIIIFILTVYCLFLVIKGIADAIYH